MKKKDIENYLSPYISRLYSFAYSLIPDELQAQQLVLDAYYVISLKSKQTIDELLNSPKSARPKYERELLLTIYQQIMKIALKREQHLQAGINSPMEFKRFYSSSVKERAVLFLKYKSDLSLDEIGLTLGGDRFVAISLLNIARNNISKDASSAKYKLASGL